MDCFCADCAALNVAGIEAKAIKRIKESLCMVFLIVQSRHRLHAKKKFTPKGSGRFTSRSRNLEAELRAQVW